MTHRSLRDARKRLGWSQQRAAAATGVSQTYLSMLETGTRALPPDLARKLVRVYGLSPTLLPPTVGRWTPRKVDSQALAEYLAALDYPQGGSWSRQSCTISKIAWDSWQPWHEKQHKRQAPLIRNAMPFLKTLNHLSGPACWPGRMRSVSLP